MWRLLKTEIKYFKWLYILSLAFVLVVNIGLTIDGRWIEAQDDFPGLRVIWLGVGIVVLFFALLFNRRSGRLRNHMLVPLSKRSLSLVRMLAFIGFWVTLISILIIFYFINFKTYPNQNWLLNLLNISGIILLINSIPILYSDFFSTYFHQNERIILMIFWGLLWLIYIIMNAIFATYFDFISPDFFAHARTSFTKLYFTTEAALLNFILGVGMFLSSIFTFNRRRLYLE